MNEAQKARIDVYIDAVARLRELRMRIPVQHWLYERFEMLEEQTIKKMREEMDDYYDPN